MSTAILSLAEMAARWRAARRIYPVYAALVRAFDLGLGPCRDLENPVDRADPEILDSVDAWFQEADCASSAHHLRSVIQTAHLATSDTLHGLIERFLDKERKKGSDRDKLDFLLVQYFAQCAPTSLHKRSLDVEEVAAVLEPVLGECSVNVPAWLEPLETVLEELDGCRTLSEVLERRLFDRAREVKEAAGEMFYGSAALLAFTRFNFLARRTFFRILHADVQQLRRLLVELERQGVAAVDCTAAGMGSKVPLAELHLVAHDWKKPFHAPYAAGRSFQQMAALIGVLEEMATRPASQPVTEAVPQPEAVSETASAEVAPEAAVDAPRLEAETTQALEVALAAEPEPEVSAGTPDEGPPAVVTDVQSVLENIAEQLLDHEPPTPTSVATVVYGTAKLILSSWEVHAFVRGGNDAADALQRGVAARALVLDAVERGKQGDRGGLPEIIGLAHVEAGLMQERVAQAKEARNIDAAVNLAATAKRLLSLIQEAEKKG